MKYELEAMVEFLTEKHNTGRANTVLLFEQGTHPSAIVSSVIVRVREETDGERIRFGGPATFNTKSARHIIKTILPIADNICMALGLSQSYFEISCVNLGAASIADIGLTISGFSADIPILLALLSAALQIEIPEDLVSTGHIASPDGDIRIVRNIPEKITAALSDVAINTFIYPDTGRDTSLDSFSPEEKSKISETLIKARGNLETIPVHNVEQLMQNVFTEESIVSSSLRLGYYTVPISSNLKNTPIGKAIRLLANDHEKRFWTVLENHFLTNRNYEIKELLLNLAGFYIQRNIYPKGTGNKLLRIIQSLPPATLRLKLEFPLLPMSECMKLISFAQESDYDDIRLLLNANFGEKYLYSKQSDQSKISKLLPAGDPGDERFKLILSEINRDTLTKTISLPIDSARAAFILDSVVIESSDEFNATITSFYVHLLRHTGRLSDQADFRSAGAEAFALLERTFQNKGGAPAAMSEARNATNGGMRLILDLMSEQFKHEEQEKHINGVLRLMLDPLDWESKVDLIRTIIKSLENQLPPEIISQPPERFAKHYEIIVKAYVETVDKVNQIFRSL